MCGIGGKLYFDPARSVEREILERMNAVQAHRGPDDSAIYCEGAMGLAHRRLSIIDLSSAGRQPMSNEDGMVRIVFNGEIYNTGATRRGGGLGHADARHDRKPGHPEMSKSPPRDKIAASGR